MIFSCDDPKQREGGVQAAVTALGAGELILLPTDTIYGIGADPFDTGAVGSLRSIKAMAPSIPLPILVGNWNAFEAVVQGVEEPVRTLIEAFWPGPLTLVMRQTETLDWNIGGPASIVQVRMPDNAVALDVLNKSGPIAVSGATRTRLGPLATVAEAEEQFGDLVSVYLDDGRLDHAVSTIIDCTRTVMRVRRKGSITIGELQEVAPNLVEEDIP